MVVDLHCHLLKEEGYLENLVREAQRLGALRLDKTTQNKIFGETAMQILNMKIN